MASRPTAANTAANSAATTALEITMNRTAFHLSSIAHRAAFGAAAAAVSLALLAGVGQTADQQFDRVVAAQAGSADAAPLQVVVITGKRLPRA